MTSFLKKVFPKKLKKPDDGVYVCSRSDYDSTFAITKIALKMITIELMHDLTPTASKWWARYHWFAMGHVFAAMVLEFLSMAQTARGGSFQDSLEIFRTMPCFGIVVLALLKSFSMVRRRHVYENLVSELGDMWHDGEVPKRQWTIMDGAKKQLLFVMKVYFWCNNALLISFLGPPVVESFKRIVGYENKLRLQFFYWLPFDPYQPVVIDIVLFWQTWQGLNVIWSNISSDFLFCSFLSHITTQFDLLALRVQSFIYVPIDKQLVEAYPLSDYSKEYLNSETDSHANMDEKMYKELGEIILRHKALLRLSADVESLFSFTLFVNFINSSFIICFCGFCCVVVEKWNDTAYKSFLATALSQTFIICWYGQKLLDSSLGLADAIYSSGWYKAPRKIRSSLLIMLHRAQEQVHVTTYGFSIVSLESYTKIIKTSWSYFTLILNIYKQ